MFYYLDINNSLGERSEKYSKYLSQLGQALGYDNPRTNSYWIIKLLFVMTHSRLVEIDI